MPEPAMDIAARVLAALLLAFAAMMFGPALPSTAMARPKQVCRSAMADAGRCDSVQRRAAPMAAPVQRGRPFAAKKRCCAWAGRKLYGGGEVAMRQLPPRLRPRRLSTLRGDDGNRPSCDEANVKRACRSERSLADALIQPPNGATAKILRETGVPVIPGVPPIVILRSPGGVPVEDASEDSP